MSVVGQALNLPFTLPITTLNGPVKRALKTTTTWSITAWDPKEAIYFRLRYISRNPFYFTIS